MTFAAIAKVAAIDSERPTSDHEQEQGHEDEKEKKQKYTCRCIPKSSQIVPAIARNAA